MDANKQRFSLAGLCVEVVVVVLFVAVLIPVISNARLRADMTAMGARGKDIFVAIVGANMEREPLGLGTVWPKTQIADEGINTANPQDIANKTFTNSTDYFNALYDKEHARTASWAPYVSGFDLSILAGAGARMTEEMLQPENNAWCIAANIRDEMEDIIPILVTRNLDCSSLYKDYDGHTDTPLRWSQKYKTPYSHKGVVIVRKGGSISKIFGKKFTTHSVYNGQSFQTTVEGRAPLVYLTPDGIAHPQ